MKITKDQLLSSDLNTLFTREPGTFFEAVLINVLWGKDGTDIDHEMIDRQKQVFGKWFKYFESNLRHDLEVELGIIKSKATADYQNGHLAGQIHALTNLPLRNGALGKSVDLNKVTQLLRQLKATEPIGVTKDELVRKDT